MLWPKDPSSLLPSLETGAKIIMFICFRISFCILIAVKMKQPAFITCRGP
uniref:Uncharacterized protein n=1 Tax=Rhizophora mucronata TaxID=61149 RepID=A0A2P2QJ32_RHIMU